MAKKGKFNYFDAFEQQIEIAMQKGGIRKTDPYTLQRFEVIRHR